jgi:Uma2 family endonuclease
MGFMKINSKPAISSAKRDLGISVEDLYPLNVAQYHAIAEAGILDEDDPVELLEGWLVCKYGPFDAWASQILPPAAASPEEEELGLTLAWIWRFDVDQYHALIEARILTEGDPVELLGGWLIQKMTQKPAHPIAVDMLRDAFASRLVRLCYVRTQAPITIADGEPEPDVAVVRGDRADYLERHPGPGDPVLVAEVADTSLARDRGVKKQMYALAGIPVYWIVNLVERQVEVYTDPVGVPHSPDYRHRRDYGPEDSIPVVLEGTEIGSVPVRELLP